MNTVSPSFYSMSNPIIQVAFAEWKAYRRGELPQTDARELRVVKLAAEIIGNPPHDILSVEKEQEIFYKIFSRAACVHLDQEALAKDSQSKPVFTPTQRLSMVMALYEHAFPKMVPGRERDRMVLIHRKFGEIVVTSIAWRLLLGSHFDDHFDRKEEPKLDPDLDLTASQVDRAGFEELLIRLFLTGPFAGQKASIIPEGVPKTLVDGNLFCLRSPQELALFYFFLMEKGGHIKWRPDDMPPSKGGSFDIVCSFIKAGICQEELPEKCPFQIILPLHEILRLYQQQTPAGLCLQAGLAAKVVYIEENLLDFETYLSVLQRIKDPKLAEQLKHNNGDFVLDPEGKEIGAHFTDKSEFINGHGSLNEDFYEAAATAIAEYEKGEKDGFKTPFSELECVALCHQLVCILVPFLENMDLKCPLILASDRQRLQRLIECAMLAHLQSKTSLLSETQIVVLKVIFGVFCGCQTKQGDSDLVCIEGQKGAVKVNKTLLMLVFENYFRAMVDFKSKTPLETIRGSGLFEDGIEALCQYMYEPLFTIETFKIWTPRQALQLVSFFQQMGESFPGKGLVVDVICDKITDLKEDPEVFGNGALIDTLLTLSADKIQELKSGSSGHDFCCIM